MEIKRFYVGFGYDVHRLSEDRLLIIGGVTVPHDRGLLGHSDADVLTHAIIDAIIGALGKGDIGQHFPDTDDAYKNISSLSLLENTVEKLTDAGFKLHNLDSTIVAQRPKLAPYIPAIRKELSTVLRADESHINIKAKTTEGLGFCGNEEGIAAYAIVSIVSAQP